MPRYHHIPKSKSVPARMCNTAGGIVAWTTSYWITPVHTPYSFWEWALSHLNFKLSIQTTIL